jgi:hypothetical protein
VVERRQVLWFESLDPMWKEASCTNISSKINLDCGESDVAVRDNGGTMLGPRPS